MLPDKTWVARLSDKKRNRKCRQLELARLIRKMAMGAVQVIQNPRICIGACWFSLSGRKMLVVFAIPPDCWNDADTLPIRS